MMNRRQFLGALLGVLLSLAPSLTAQENALVSDKLVAGGPDDFMTVRHLVLQGSQEEIGRSLAQIARNDLNTGPWPANEPRTSRVIDKYLRRNWPQHHARMRGAARFFGGSTDDERRHWSMLSYDLTDMFGCTVAYYPPASTDDGKPVLSRNLDFTSGTARGRRPQSDQRAAMSRPFVIEAYPDEGHACLFITCMELLGSAFDGVNEKGLTVALLADGELMRKYDMQPRGDLAVGLAEIQVPRYLLETCATAEEAREALLEIRQYYAFVPCHYIVGDRSGDAFVFEMAPGRNRSYFIEKSGKPLVTTNFMLHLNPDGEGMQSGGPKSSIARYRAVLDAVDRAEGKLDLSEIVDANSCASFDGPGPPDNVPYAPHRTLWHALYFPADATMRVDFYLGEGANQDGGTKPVIRRSGYVEFALEPRKSD